MDGKTAKEGTHVGLWIKVKDLWDKFDTLFEHAGEQLNLGAWTFGVFEGPVENEPDYVHPTQDNLGRGRERDDGASSSSSKRHKTAMTKVEENAQMKSALDKIAKDRDDQFHHPAQPWNIRRAKPFEFDQSMVPRDFHLLMGFRVPRIIEMICCDTKKIVPLTVVSYSGVKNPLEAFIRKEMIVLTIEHKAHSTLPHRYSEAELQQLDEENLTLCMNRGEVEPWMLYDSKASGSAARAAVAGGHASLPAFSAPSASSAAPAFSAPAASSAAPASSAPSASPAPPPVLPFVPALVPGPASVPAPQVAAQRHSRAPSAKQLRCAAMAAQKIASQNP